jgi:hypothetical protein
VNRGILYDANVVDTCLRLFNEKSHALFFSQVHDPLIEQTWRKYFHRKFRLFCADQRNMRAAVFMRAAGDSVTRIAFALESSPSVYLPAWVFRVMTRIFFPQLIEDTDKYLYKKRILKGNTGQVEPRRRESAAPKNSFCSFSRRRLWRHPVAEGPRQNRGPSA